MIKNCIIYNIPKEFKELWQVDSDLIRNSRLADCQMNAKTLFKPKIKSLLQLAQNEKLELSKETPNHYEFKTFCEFKMPQLLAAGISPYTEAEYKIWLRKEQSTVVTFDAGRKLSSIGIALLSNALSNDPSLIKNVKFHKDNFLQLIDWLLSNKRSGQIKRINFKDIDYDQLKFKQIVLTADHLQESSLVNDLSKLTKGIADITFMTPPLKASDRALICRLNHWGSITLYTPNLLDSEITELILIIENILYQDIKNENASNSS